MNQEESEFMRSIDCRVRDVECEEYGCDSKMGIYGAYSMRRKFNETFSDKKLLESEVDELKKILGNGHNYIMTKSRLNGYKVYRIHEGIVLEDCLYSRPILCFSHTQLPKKGQESEFEEIMYSEKQNKLRELFGI